MRHSELRVPVTARLPIPTLDAVNAMVADRKYRSTAAATAGLVELGLRVVAHQEMMRDPERANEFQAKMDEVVKAGQIFEFLQTISETELRGFAGAAELELERRHTQTQLVERGDQIAARVAREGARV